MSLKGAERLDAELAGVRSIGGAGAAEGWLGARLLQPEGVSEVVHFWPGRLAEEGPPRAPVQADGVATDGFITCVRKDAGSAVAGGVLLEGSRLSRGGEAIAEVDPAGAVLAGSPGVSARRCPSWPGRRLVDRPEKRLPELVRETLRH